MSSCVSNIETGVIYQTYGQGLSTYPDQDQVGISRCLLHGLIVPAGLPDVVVRM
jgi:hypothetical protein